MGEAGNRKGEGFSFLYIAENSLNEMMNILFLLENSMILTGICSEQPGFMLY